MRLYANHVSVGQSGGEYFQVSFDSEAPSDDDFDLSEPDRPYLVIQRQFEDDDDSVCYIETHDQDTYTGHFRLKLIEFTATHLAFEIARTDHKCVEAIYELDAQRFGEVQRIVPSFLACKAETAASASGSLASVLAIGLRTRWRPVSGQVPPSPRTSRGDGF